MLKLMMNPSLWLAVLLGAIALFGSGYAMGTKHASSSCVADQAKAQQAAQAGADETNTRREQVAQSREVTREIIRVVYRTIKEKADENVKNNAAAYVACGLDADGLHEWNAANSGITSPLSGEPDYTLPAAATGKIWSLGGSAAEPYRGDGAGSAVPGSAQEAGGM